MFSLAAGHTANGSISEFAEAASSENLAAFLSFHTLQVNTATSGISGFPEAANAVNANKRKGIICFDTSLHGLKSGWLGGWGEHKHLERILLVHGSQKRGAWVGAQPFANRTLSAMGVGRGPYGV